MTREHATKPDGILYFIGGQLLFEHHNGQGGVVRKCLSPDAARQAFTRQRTDSGWLSPHTIRHGENERGPWVLQRYEPAAYRLILEDPLPVQGQSMPLHTLQVWLPGMVFLGIQKRYFLWTYRTWKQQATTLYHAPVPNVDTKGQICYGQLRPPIAAVETIDQAWTLFWNSPFNRDLASDKSRQYPDCILTLLATLHQHELAQLAPYPESDLKRSPITMEAILKELTTTHEEERDAS